MDSDEDTPFVQAKRPRADELQAPKPMEMDKVPTPQPVPVPVTPVPEVKPKAEEKPAAPKPKPDAKKSGSSPNTEKKSEKKDGAKKDGDKAAVKKEKEEKKDDKKRADDDDDIPLDQLAKKPAKEKEKAAPAKKKAKSDDAPKKRKAEEDVDIVGEGSVAPPKSETPKKTRKEKDSGDKEEKKSKPKKKKKADGDDDIPAAASGHHGGDGAGDEGAEAAPGDAEPNSDDDEGEGEGDSKWWKQAGGGDGKKWHTLVHNGVLFPPPYVPHGRPVLYEGEAVKLTPEQEEWATYYANYLETDHVKNKIFNKNFFEDWLKVLNPDKRKEHTIKDFSKCDFTLIHKYLVEQKDQKKSRNKEQKEKEKKEKETMQEKYGFAMVNNIKEKVGNFKIEPPGLFLGRGAHPKTGKFKYRIQPEDVTLNLSEDAPVPPTPIEGHKWKAVVHDNTVAWLAFWKENINGGTKYVWLSPGSRIKGESDMKKFETARKLKTKIKDIRGKYEDELSSSDLMVRQRATALWIIDHLALRVGNEKGEDTADTVGCCSLRFEHIKLKPPRTVKFDFLGKDSMPYKNTVEVDQRVWDNLKQFTEGKRPGAEIFDKLTTSALNQHLKNQMDGLTAKVFRTYNASFTLERELDKAQIDPNDTVGEKLLAFNRANREVAILCNHQRSTPKKFDEQMGKLDEKIKELKGDKEKLIQHAKDLKAGKAVKSEVKDEDESDDEKSDNAANTSGVGEESTKKKEKKKKPLRLPDDPEKCKAQIDRIDKKIQALEFKKTEKDELKTVALGTSKINYIDPRITAAWCKRMNVPIEKVFTKALREKFPWALEVPKNWRF